MLPVAWAYEELSRMEWMVIYTNDEKDLLMAALLGPDWGAGQIPDQQVCPHSKEVTAHTQFCRDLEGKGGKFLVRRLQVSNFLALRIRRANSIPQEFVSDLSMSEQDLIPICEQSWDSEKLDR